MTPYDLETIVRGVRSARNDLREAGAENAASLTPLICELLEILLQHEANKETDRRRAGDS
jgi:hypothetical protein